MTTTKILDTTVISACMNTIVSVNLLEICMVEYRTVTSKSVYDETVLGFSKEMVEKTFQRIPVVDCSDEEGYQKMISYLRNRYPYLGEGELSTVILALVKFTTDGSSSYIVTDDMRFKKKFPEILSAPPIIKEFGQNVSRARVTGTIGLIRQLYRRRRISPGIMRGIIADLRKGTLYITNKLIDELRECLE